MTAGAVVAEIEAEAAVLAALASVAIVLRWIGEAAAVVCVVYFGQGHAQDEYSSDLSY